MGKSKQADIVSSSAAPDADTRFTSAPSPACGGYFPINGEDQAGSHRQSSAAPDPDTRFTSAPSPACGGYFPINGEEQAGSPRQFKRSAGPRHEVHISPIPRLRRVLPHEWGRA